MAALQTTPSLRGRILTALGLADVDAVIAERERAIAAYAELKRVLDAANRFGDALVTLKAGLAQRGFTPGEGPSGLVTATLAIIDRAKAPTRDAVTDETHLQNAEHDASAGPDTTPQHSDPWRLAEWNRLPDRCLIAACDSHDIDQRGPIFLSDQSMRKACTEHWEAITRVLGDQASWERVDAWSPQTSERKS